MLSRSEKMRMDDDSDSPDRMFSCIYDDIDDNEVFGLSNLSSPFVTTATSSEAKDATVSANVLQEKETLKELVDKLQTEKSLLELRISQLYKTAKSEIARKDKRLQEQQEQINNFLFRRKSYLRDQTRHRANDQPEKELSNSESQKNNKVLNKQSCEADKNNQPNIAREQPEKELTNEGFQRFNPHYKIPKKQFCETTDNNRPNYKEEGKYVKPKSHDLSSKKKSICEDNQRKLPSPSRECFQKNLYREKDVKNTNDYKEKCPARRKDVLVEDIQQKEKKPKTPPGSPPRANYKEGDKYGTPQSQRYKYHDLSDRRNSICEEDNQRKLPSLSQECFQKNLPREKDVKNTIDYKDKCPPSKKDVLVEDIQQKEKKLSKTPPGSPPEANYKEEDKYGKPPSQQSKYHDLSSKRTSICKDNQKKLPSPPREPLQKNLPREKDIKNTNDYKEKCPSSRKSVLVEDIQQKERKPPKTPPGSPSKARHLDERSRNRMLQNRLDIKRTSVKSPYKSALRDKYKDSNVNRQSRSTSWESQDSKANSKEINHPRIKARLRENQDRGRDFRRRSRSRRRPSRSPDKFSQRRNIDKGGRNDNYRSRRSTSSERDLDRRNRGYFNRNRYDRCSPINNRRKMRSREDFRRVAAKLSMERDINEVKKIWIEHRGICRDAAKSQLAKRKTFKCNESDKSDLDSLKLHLSDSGGESSEVNCHRKEKVTLKYNEKNVDINLDNADIPLDVLQRLIYEKMQVLNDTKDFQESLLAESDVEEGECTDEEFSSIKATIKKNVDDDEKTAAIVNETTTKLKVQERDLESNKTYKSERKNNAEKCADGLVEESKTVAINLHSKNDIHQQESAGSQLKIQTDLNVNQSAPSNVVEESNIVPKVYSRDVSKHNIREPYACVFEHIGKIKETYNVVNLMEKNETGLKESLVATTKENTSEDNCVPEGSILAETKVKCLDKNQLVDVQQKNSKKVIGLEAYKKRTRKDDNVEKGNLDNSDVTENTQQKLEKNKDFSNMPSADKIVQQEDSKMMRDEQPTDKHVLPSVSHSSVNYDDYPLSTDAIIVISEESNNVNELGSNEKDSFLHDLSVSEDEEDFPRANTSIPTNVSQGGRGKINIIDIIVVKPSDVIKPVNLCDQRPDSAPLVESIESIQEAIQSNTSVKVQTSSVNVINECDAKMLQQCLEDDPKPSENRPNIESNVKPCLPQIDDIGGFTYNEKIKYLFGTPSPCKPTASKTKGNKKKENVRKNLLTKMKTTREVLPTKNTTTKPIANKKATPKKSRKTAKPKASEILDVEPISSNFISKTIDEEEKRISDLKKFNSPSYIPQSKVDQLLLERNRVKVKEGNDSMEQPKPKKKGLEQKKKRNTHKVNNVSPVREPASKKHVGFMSVKIKLKKSKPKITGAKNKTESNAPSNNDNSREKEASKDKKSTIKNISNQKEGTNEATKEQRSDNEDKVENKSITPKSSKAKVTRERTSKNKKSTIENILNQKEETNEGTKEQHSDNEDKVENKSVTPKSSKAKVTKERASKYKKSTIENILNQKEDANERKEELTNIERVLVQSVTEIHTEVRRSNVRKQVGLYKNVVAEVKTPRRITPTKIGDVSKLTTTMSSEISTKRRLSESGEEYRRPGKVQKTTSTSTEIVIENIKQSPLPHMEEMLKTLEKNVSEKGVNCGFIRHQSSSPIKMDTNPHQQEPLFGENSIPVLNLDTKDVDMLGSFEHDLYDNMNVYLYDKSFESDDKSKGDKSKRIKEEMNQMYFANRINKNTNTSTPIKTKEVATQCDNDQSISSLQAKSIKNSGIVSTKSFLVSPLKRDRTKKITMVLLDPT